MTVNSLHRQHYIMENGNLSLYCLIWLWSGQNLRFYLELIAKLMISVLCQPRSRIMRSNYVINHRDIQDTLIFDYIWYRSNHSTILHSLLQCRNRYRFHTDDRFVVERFQIQCWLRHYWKLVMFIIRNIYSTSSWESINA